MYLHAVTALALAAAGCRHRFEDVADAAASGGDDVGDADDANTADASMDAPACATELCDNFETGISPTWDNTDMAGTGQGMATGGALVVTLSATSDRYFLVETMPAPTTSVTISMKIGYATTNAGTDCELDLARLTFNAATCAVPYGFYLVRDGTGPFNLQETNGNAGCNGNRNNNTSNLDNTGLHDVRLTVTVGNPGHVKLEVDGSPVRDMPTLQLVPSSQMTFTLGGVIVRNAAAPWTITYDDVDVVVQ